MDPRLATAYAVTLLAGYLMVLAGVRKRRLAWRSHSRQRLSRRLQVRRRRRSRCRSGGSF